MIGQRSLRSRVSRFAYRFGQALWVLPALSMAGGILLAMTVSRVEKTTPTGLGGLLTTGGAVGARDLVETVASTTLSVTTFTFSVTVVVLQVAASQYSPRLPRQFIRDRGTQIVLALFILTFVYSMSVLRSIDADAEFVPRLAVTVAFFLALVSVGAFVYFINHIVNAIRIEQILRHVEGETVAALERNHPVRESSDPHPEQPTIPQRAVPVLAPGSRIIQQVDGISLAGFAEERDLLIRLVRVVGEQAVAGAPLAWAWARDAQAPAPDGEELQPHILGAIDFGRERTLRTDVAFGLTQLVDIALRAVSSAINDPTTACSSLRSAEVVLVQLCQHHLGDLLFCGSDGELRVAVPQRSFAAYLDLVITPIRRTCPDDVSVMLRMCEMLADVGRAAVDDDEQRAAVSGQLDLVLGAADAAIQERSDRDRLHEAVAQARRALDGKPPRRR